MRLIVLMSVILLVSCQSVHFDTAHHAFDGDGVHIRKVDLYDQNPLVCYSEIRGDSLVGVSCQNNLGITEFAVGVQYAQLTVKKITPMVSQTRLQTVVDILTLALFEQVDSSVSMRYNIQRSDNKILIQTGDKIVAEVIQ